MWTPKVQFLKPSELDSAVTELLQKFARAQRKPIRPPIPIDDIIEKYLRLDFAIVDLAAELGVDDVLGATWFEEARIRVDERLEGQEGRICFTMAHEVGHWVLHRPQYEADKLNVPLFPRQPVADHAPAVVCRTTEKKAPAEWQADQFAARLLMPETFVRGAFREAAARDSHHSVGSGLRRREGDPEAQLRDTAARVIAVGEFTNVSNEAMRIRLAELGLVRSERQVERLL